MIKYPVVLLLFIQFLQTSWQRDDFEQIKQIVFQWAPLIWMSPDEKYYPSNVENFLENVQLADNGGKLIVASINETQFPQIKTRSLYLVTSSSLDELKKKEKSFLNGFNPETHTIPTYVIISPCNSMNTSFNREKNSTEPQLFFSVTYWLFYPYNYGKSVCFLGNVPTLTLFGRCFGRKRTIGSHVGDWEHMTLFFKGAPFPSEMYLASHSSGVYYKFDANQWHFKQKLNNKKWTRQSVPRVVLLERGRPVVFAANGSHGLWPSAGEHEYVKFPHLVDKCGYGVPWKTWKNLQMFMLGKTKLPKWLHFRGRWGNPKTNCVWSKKFGLCEHTDGPPGILRNKHEFLC